MPATEVFGFPLSWVLDFSPLCLLYFGFEILGYAFGLGFGEREREVGMTDGAA